MLYDMYLYPLSPRGIVSNVVNEFELHLHFYVQFLTNTLEKSMNPLIHLAMG